MLAGKDNLCILLRYHGTQHLTHSGCGPRMGSRPLRVETFQRSHSETTFQVYKHFDLTGNRTPVAWIKIESTNHYTRDPQTCL